MDDFARLSSKERQRYFGEASERLDLTAQIIEKDFWVCWCLKRLFLLPEFQGHLTFKGGTSLSKVYHVIERFSEDVDVSIERAFLGFGGRNEPEAASSKKQQHHRIEALQQKCQEAIAEQLEPQLRQAIASALATDGGWSLEQDPHDPDGQTLLFQYPPAIASSLSPYFASSVKIELVARSDAFPVESASISPILCNAFSDALQEKHCVVRALAAERTFWEKATILHMLHHAPDEGKLKPGMSRHYYDVYEMAQSSVFERAMKSIDLLRRVAAHKSVFFKAAWANYDTARPGTLCLMPCDVIVQGLKTDYQAMREMFHSEPPPFDEILSSLLDLEHQINHAQQ
ncbi:MAG: nucleotidyl transferase AbiEii/AbiGii toxin family protein [Pirellulales bacterium]|nr:nucleotidyl transferase AbiEii/AbiGii toxin family protein [Pirellulales bacterium]